MSNKLQNNIDTLESCRFELVIYKDTTGLIGLIIKVVVLAFTQVIAIGREVQDIKRRLGPETSMKPLGLLKHHTEDLKRKEE